MDSPATGATQVDLDHVHRNAQAIIDMLTAALSGRREAIELAMTVLLASGHLLIEDVPGVGKTTLAKALAKAIDVPVGRIQFTPDLLPADLTGTNVFRAERGEFQFIPGPIFANIVIGDEINRASPKTQSALLECMQEGQVTIDGVTYRLPSPFLVMATQNPVETEGTYPLPEAQQDRFMATLAVGYPTAGEEFDMLERHEVADPLDAVQPLIDAAGIATMIDSVRRLHASAHVKRYVLELVRATRDEDAIHLGASPRAAIQLMRAAKARAAIVGRDYVLPDDVQPLVLPVLGHRLVVHREARAAGITAQSALLSVLARIPAGG